MTRRRQRRLRIAYNRALRTEAMYYLTDDREWKRRHGYRLRMQVALTRLDTPSRRLLLRTIELEAQRAWQMTRMELHNNP